MAAKKTRLEMLRTLVTNNVYESQEELLDALRNEGFAVAQPTLSRDLRTLKVSKVCTEGGYAYVLPSATEQAEKYSPTPHSYGFKSVDFSGNIAVFKTINGHASSLSTVIDDRHVREIVGTVAGDDTIIAVLREGTPRSVIFNLLREIIPNYGE